MGGTVVISTHLDDAVLSVGQFLGASPDAVVVTVLAGMPGPDTVDPYDRGCGFANSEQAIRHRRGEDETALRMLGVRAEHLDLFGVQYGPHSADEITDTLTGVLDRLAPTRVVGPIGLVHPDHRRVGAAWLRALCRRPGVEAFAYEDLPYRHTFPRRSRKAIDAFVDAHTHGHTAGPARLFEADRGIKACAMLAYSSQLRTATPLKCLEPERLWRLARRPEEV